MIEVKRQEASLRIRRVCTKIPPVKGERVYIVIPPFRLTTLTAGVISTPVQMVSPSCIWRHENSSKYEDVIENRLVPEGKMACIGVIQTDLSVKISAEGKKILDGLNERYNWATNW